MLHGIVTKTLEILALALEGLSPTMSKYTRRTPAERP